MQGRMGETSAPFLSLSLLLFFSFSARGVDHVRQQRMCVLRLFYRFASAAVSGRRAAEREQSRREGLHKACLSCPPSLSPLGCLLARPFFSCALFFGCALPPSHSPPSPSLTRGPRSKSRGERGGKNGRRRHNVAVTQQPASSPLAPLSAWHSPTADPLTR